jgi:hypothetical protein
METYERPILPGAKYSASAVVDEEVTTRYPQTWYKIYTWERTRQFCKESRNKKNEKREYLEVTWSRFEWRVDAPFRAHKKTASIRLQLTGVKLDS